MRFAGRCGAAPIPGCLRQRGFSLLEVLVAFTLLATTFGVVMQALSSNSRGLALAGEHSRAALIAESKLAQVGTLYPLEAGYQEGDLETGYHWRLSMSEFGAEQGYLKQSAFRVRVEVSWGPAARERRYLLTSLRYR
ncbi:MAG: prepilin-type N-terminal cleavage/methylation domain-containing protein [Candidatus Thiodiazotropha sp.]